MNYSQTAAWKPRSWKLPAKTAWSISRALFPSEAKHQILREILNDVLDFNEVVDDIVSIVSSGNESKGGRMEFVATNRPRSLPMKKRLKSTPKHRSRPVSP